MVRKTIFCHESVERSHNVMYTVGMILWVSPLTSMGAGEKNCAEVISLGYSGPCCWGVLGSCELIIWNFKTSSVMFQIVTTISSYEYTVIKNNRRKAPDRWMATTLQWVFSVQFRISMSSWTFVLLLPFFPPATITCSKCVTPQDYSSQLSNQGKTLSKSG